MNQKTPLHFSLSSHTGVLILSDKEDLFYDVNNLSFITHYDFDLQHLKAVYDVGIDELLKSDVLIGLELPKGYTIEDFIAQIKEDHNHNKESLQEHLQSLLSDMVRLLKHINKKDGLDGMSYVDFTQPFHPFHFYVSTFFAHETD